VGDQFVINSTAARVVECHATFTLDGDPTTGVPAYYCTLANVSFPQLLPEAMLDGCLFGLRVTENDDARSSGSSVLSSASAMLERNNSISVIARYAHYQARHGPSGAWDSRRGGAAIAPKTTCQKCLLRMFTSVRYGEHLLPRQSEALNAQMLESIGCASTMGPFAILSSLGSMNAQRSIT
jgi:hypothetical protein